MMRALIRYSFFYATLLLAACTTSKEPSPELRVEEISIYADPDANQNSALSTDLVIAYSNDLLKKLEKMSACTYFAGYEQLLMDYPGLIDVWRWEFVPGQHVDHFEPSSEKGRAFGAFIFANYLTPGEHRLKVAPDGVVKILLQKNDLKDLSPAVVGALQPGTSANQPAASCCSKATTNRSWSSLADFMVSDDPEDLREGPVTSNPCPPVVHCTPGGTGGAVEVQALPPAQGVAAQPHHHKHHHHKHKHKHHHSTHGGHHGSSQH